MRAVFYPAQDLNIVNRPMSSAEFDDLLSRALNHADEVIVAPKGERFEVVYYCVETILRQVVCVIHNEFDTYEEALVDFETRYRYDEED